MSILIATAEAFAVTVGEILGPRRCGRITRARYAAAYAMSRAGVSGKEIARRLNRHHTTIIYALERANVLMAWDAEFYRRVHQVLHTDAKPCAAIGKFPYPHRSLAEVDAAGEAA